VILIDFPQAWQATGTPGPNIVFLSAEIAGLPHYGHWYIFHHDSFVKKSSALVTGECMVSGTTSIVYPCHRDVPLRYPAFCKKANLANF